MSRKHPKTPQNSPSANQRREHTQEESTNRHVYVEPGVQIDFVQDLKKKYETAQADSRTQYEKQLFWTKVAACLLLLTAGFAGWQGCLTRESIDNSSKQFQKDQRPYVWSTGAEGIHFGKDEWMKMEFRLVNYGRSPAVRATGLGKIFVGKEAMQDADKWFSDLGDAPLPNLAAEQGETVVPPGLPANPQRPFGGYITVFTDSSLTQSDVDYILNTDNPYAAVMRFQYYDSYGTRYWSDFCISRIKTGEAPKCKTHNEIH